MQAKFIVVLTVRHDNGLPQQRLGWKIWYAPKFPSTNKLDLMVKPHIWTCEYSQCTILTLLQVYNIVGILNVLLNAQHNAMKCRITYRNDPAYTVNRLASLP